MWIDTWHLFCIKRAFTVCLQIRLYHLKMKARMKLQIMQDYPSIHILQMLKDIISTPNPPPPTPGQTVFVCGVGWGGGGWGSRLGGGIYCFHIVHPFVCPSVHYISVSASYLAKGSHYLVGYLISTGYCHLLLCLTFHTWYLNALVPHCDYHTVINIKVDFVLMKLRNNIIIIYYPFGAKILLVPSKYISTYTVFVLSGQYVESDNFVTTCMAVTKRGTVKPV